MDRQAGKILILLYLLLCTASCVKDRPTPRGNTYSAKGDVYIVCEGNFGTGDASLYTYDPATDSVYGDLYSAANGQPLGDVFQSMLRMGDSLYLCINNSDKIVVLNATDRKLAGTISIPKPRYILPTGNGKAYVSTLYSHNIYTIDVHTLQVTGTIALPDRNPEGMCLHNGSVVVCPWDTLCNKVYQLDAATGHITRSVALPGYSPHAVVVDKDQMLWVMAGNVTKKRRATLSRIDPSTGTVLKTYTFPEKTDPIKPIFNATRDTLYFIQVKYDGSTADNGIYRMSIYDAALPATAFVQGTKYQYYWALGIEPATGHIYVGDPKGFVQKGNVTVYRPDGALVTTFLTGLGPGMFYFK
ncbi:YncE family protein [Nemorincola caseinilytica]|uniref:YncE family protein n=1 Tax=Nemorincola caseinilytica TaxID=2054315 RepID=A0ABP8N9D8_9BACT